MSAVLTVQEALNQAHPNNWLDILRKRAAASQTVIQWGFGDMIKGIKRTVAQTAAATIALSPPARPGTVMCRVTTVGTAAAGIRAVADVGATPSATLATLSDDGATLTFEGTVTGAVIQYTPKPTDTELAANAYPIA